MKNVHISFLRLGIEYNSLSPLILRIDREEDASLKRRTSELYKNMYCPFDKLFSDEHCLLSDKL